KTLIGATPIFLPRMAALDVAQRMSCIVPQARNPLRWRERVPRRHSRESGNPVLRHTSPGLLGCPPPRAMTPLCNSIGTTFVLAFRKPGLQHPVQDFSRRGARHVVIADE